MHNKRNLLRDLNEVAGLEPDADSTEHAIQRARSVLEAASSSIPLRPLSIFGAQLMRPRNLVAIAAAALFMVLCTQWLPTPTGGSFAFAQVQEQVAKTKSVQYKQVLTQTLADGRTSVPTISHVQILGDHLKREELESSSDNPLGKYFTIRDLKQRKELVLFPDLKAYALTASPPSFTDAYMDPNWESGDHPESKQPSEQSDAGAKLEGKNTWQPSAPSSSLTNSAGKTADNSWDVSSANSDSKYTGQTRADSKPAQSPNVNAELVTGDWTANATDSFSKLKPLAQLDIFELVRHVPTEKAKQLPEKLIGGKKAIGFVVEQADKNKFGTTLWKHVWWVDPNTKLPVRLEVKSHGDDPRSGVDERVISDIVFNAPLEESLFSLEQPKGYRDMRIVAAEMFGPNKLSAAPHKKMEFVFADMQEQVDKAKTLQYVMTVKQKTKEAEDKSLHKDVLDEPGVLRYPAESTSVLRVMISGPDLMRQESSMNHSKVKEFEEKGIASHHIHITNFNQRKEIFLYPDKKSFVIPQGGPPPKVGKSDKATATETATSASNFSNQHTEPDLYAMMRVPDDSTKKLPEQTVDGKKVVGFYVEKSTDSPHGKTVQKYTYWVDPETKQPVRIEHRWSGPEVGARRTSDGKWEETVGHGETDMVIHDIVFDAPLDPTLFSTDPPAGYTDMAAKKSEETTKPKTK